MYAHLLCLLYLKILDLPLLSFWWNQSVYRILCVQYRKAGWHWEKKYIFRLYVFFSGTYFQTVLQCLKWIYNFFLEKNMKVKVPMKSEFCSVTLFYGINNLFSTSKIMYQRIFQNKIKQFLKTNCLLMDATNSMFCLWCCRLCCLLWKNFKIS